MDLGAVLVVVAAYLLGSVDFAVLVARAKGVDIYSVGSGNPGTANVLRTVGRGAAAMVMGGDLLKGVVAAAAGQLITGDIVIGYAAGAAAVLGHCFPIWHRFKGGKGVATGAGMVLWLAWPAFILLVVVWVVVVVLTRISSIASVAGAILVVPSIALSAGVELIDPPPQAAYVITAAMALLVIIRHIPNLRRLLRGEESTVAPSSQAVEGGVEPGAS
ncbi:MAG TPA: glycerol-3-phosphate 1-O-acyltransferase PlsY [Acidimicrobiia bacterium]|nr:glycerol-3-phosphate 1-O-acyltransferase PlsY [Acidimicrobiia bacterium]